LRHRQIATLSGGERQRVAVAAALALQPSILALDEPTSQLDPWGAEEVVAALNRLNEDLGLTIVLAEHRLERVVAHADRLTVLAPGGTVGLDGPPRETLCQVDVGSLPALLALGRRLDWDPLPLLIKEGESCAAPRRRTRACARSGDARSCSAWWRTRRRIAAGERWVGSPPRATRRRSGGAPGRIGCAHGP
jgi:hypothetical protein